MAYKIGNRDQKTLLAQNSKDGIVNYLLRWSVSES